MKKSENQTQSSVWKILITEIPSRKWPTLEISIDTDLSQFKKGLCFINKRNSQDQGWTDAGYQLYAIATLHFSFFIRKEYNQIYPLASWINWSSDERSYKYYSIGQTFTLYWTWYQHWHSPLLIGTGWKNTSVTNTGPTLYLASTSLGRNYKNFLLA